MYTPRHFAVEDRAQQLALIDRYPFGTLITARAGSVRISTVPFLLDGDARLIGHVARANPHWREFEGGTDAVVSFVGPNAYVSPNWYGDAANMVPTWNYVAIEVRGRINLLEDKAARLDVVDRLSARHEANLPNPWRSTKMDPALRGKLLDAIAAFRIDIDTIDAKLKLSQNRTVDDVRSAAAELAALDGDSNARQLAAWMLEARGSRS